MILNLGHGPVTSGSRFEKAGIRGRSRVWKRVNTLKEKGGGEARWKRWLTARVRNERKSREEKYHCD